MANFEGLIRQALQNQNAGDPAVRQRIYQSSRNALTKMLQKSPDLSDEAAKRQVDSLEASIASIEADYAAAEQPAPPDDAASHRPPDAMPDTAGQQTADLQAEPQQRHQPGAAPDRSEETDPVLAMLEQASLGTTGGMPGESRDQQPETAQGAPSIDEAPSAAAEGNDPHAPYPDESLNLDNYTPEPLFPLPQSEPAVNLDLPASGIRQEPSDPVMPQPENSDSGASTHPSTVTSVPEPPPAVGEPQSGAALTGEDQGNGLAAAEAPHRNDLDELTAEREPYPVYNRKHPILRRIWPIALALGILLVVLWVMYALFANMGDKNAANGQADNPGPVGETQLSDDGSATITLLEPTDLSALVTAGRGTAELTTIQNEQMLRLQSVRQDGQASVSAEPILLEMERGVLQQIMGKPVTVELFAKSGLTGPAQFAIECSVGGESVCGRKRFRVGQQPERIVFSMDMNNVTDSGARAFLAVNTDITTEADTSGKGDIIDLIYARLRFEP